jgi:hypothetical protein
MEDDPTTSNRSFQRKCNEWAAKVTGKADADPSVVYNVTRGCELLVKGGTSKVCFEHLFAILDIVTDLLKDGCRASDIMVLLFYSEAVRQMKAIMRYFGHDNIDVILDSIATIDATQGSERMITIIGPGKDGVRGKPLGFVDSKRRINVALTRAKGLRILVLNKNMGTQSATTLESLGKAFWRDLIADHEKEGQMVDVDVGDVWANHRDILPSKARYTDVVKDFRV